MPTLYFSSVIDPSSPQQLMQVAHTDQSSDGLETQSIYFYVQSGQSDVLQPELLSCPLLGLYLSCF